MTTFLECSLLQMSPEAPLKPAQTISLLSDALQGRDSSHNHVLDVNLDGFSAKAFIPHGKRFHLQQRLLPVQLELLMAYTGVIKHLSIVY